MAPGDVTVIGPYNPTATGVALMDTALTALSSGAASDFIGVIPMIQNAGFFVFWVEGA